jgi:Zn-dependent M28 family amino/carboxypeptidase
VISNRFFPKHFIALLVVFLASFCGGLPPANLASVPATSVDSITPTELRMHLEFLASPELGGRYTLGPNFGVVARYLAAHLEADGFHPAGDHGDFLQHFSVIATKPDVEKSSLAITNKGNTANYSFGDFFTPGGVSGQAEGQLVFVGYGISSRAQNHDDYAKLDVKGKIVVIAPGSPAGVDQSKLQREESGARAAASHGAVGALVIPPSRFADMMKNKDFRDRAALRESVHLADSDEAALPSMTLGLDLSQKVLSLFGLSYQDMQNAEQEHTPLTPKASDASARFVVAVHERRVTTQNVVGILEGTDPVLRNQYVVFSAHYDHLQTNDKGEIYPGADDDGSGTTSVLAIAHAMGLDRPKRSIMVIFHAGEELGLLGSEYNTDVAPAVPLDKIVADLNIDMIGRSKPQGDQNRADARLSDANTVYLVGSDRISKELHQISEETNSDYQKLNLDYYYNGPTNPDRIYFRSDHWNYAKHGIPVIFYFDGIHVDYHKPTDTVDKIDFTKMTRIARLVFETGWRIANLDHNLAKDEN